MTHQPALDWGTVAQGEKVRGHVGFRVAKQAKGLVLVCNTDAVPNYKPVHIALGQSKASPMKRWTKRRGFAHLDRGRGRILN